MTFKRKVLAALTRVELFEVGRALDLGMLGAKIQLFGEDCSHGAWAASASISMS